MERTSGDLDITSICCYRGNIRGSMKELGVHDRRCSWLDVLKLTETTILPPVGGEGGGRSKNVATHCGGRIGFTV